MTIAATETYGALWLVPRTLWTTRRPAMRRTVISTVEIIVRATEREKYGMAKLITTDVSAVDWYSTIIEQAVRYSLVKVSRQRTPSELTCRSEEYQERNTNDPKVAAPDKIQAIKLKWVIQWVIPRRDKNYVKLTMRRSAIKFVTIYTPLRKRLSRTSNTCELNDRPAAVGSFGFTWLSIKIIWSILIPAPVIIVAPAKSNVAKINIVHWNGSLVFFLLNRK